MKVLWFANTPCGASKRLMPGLQYGGWLVALEEQLAANPEVDLNVSFYWKERIESFRIGNVNYFPIYRKASRSKLSRLIARAFNSVGNDAAELDAMADVVSKVKPDIVHVHGTEDNFGLIQDRISVPVVISMQGVLTPYLEKYYAGVPENVVNRYSGIKERLFFNSYETSYGILKKKAIREKEIFSKAKCVIGRTDWDRRVSRVLAPNARYYHADEMMRSIFYDGVWQKKERDVFKIVTVASEGLYKGLEVVVKTSRLLAGRMAIEWVVIGQREDGRLASIVKKWLKCDFSALGIRFLGVVGPDALKKELLDSDLYCQVSHIENSPNGLCEAMLLGVPCLASYAGGTATMLANGDAGVLVQDGDPYALAGAVIEMASNLVDTSSVLESCQRIAHERHLICSCCDAHLSVYKNMVG